MGEDWNPWRDLVAPLVIILLVIMAGYMMGGADLFNP